MVLSPRAVDMWALEGDCGVVLRLGAPRGMAWMIDTKMFLWRWSVQGHTPSGYGAISTVGMGASVLAIYRIDIILLITYA